MKNKKKTLKKIKTMKNLKNKLKMMLKIDNGVMKIEKNNNKKYLKFEL
jgi:hypothetical protein